MTARTGYAAIRLGDGEETPEDAGRLIRMAQAELAHWPELSLKIRVAYIRLYGVAHKPDAKLCTEDRQAVSLVISPLRSFADEPD